jgi:hypothetical protein
MLPENAGRTATEVDTSLRQLKKEVKWCSQYTDIIV